MTVALESVEKPNVAGFVDVKHRSKNQARIDRDEAELKALLEGKEPEQEEVLEVKEEAEPPAPVSKEEESFKKRYGDLRRHMAEKEKEWEAKFETLKTQTSSPIVPPKSDEDLQDWVSKYPDIAGIVARLVEKQIGTQLEGTINNVKELDELRWQTKKDQAEAQVRKAHSDWDDLKSSDEFHEWVEEQPKWVQDALYEQIEDSRAVIRVVDLYKADNKIANLTAKELAKQAAGVVKAPNKVAVESESGPTFSESQVEKMSAKEYEDNEAAIMKAMQEGRFKYDRTGGAR